MSWLRIKTVVRRHWYVLWRSPNRWFDIAVWPVFDVLLFGSLGAFVSQENDASRAAAPYLLAGIMLFHVLFQCQIAVTTGFMEETWSRNLLNIMTTPITETEYTAGLAVYAFMKLIMAMATISVIALITYQFHLDSIGWGLVPIVGILLLVGWAVSLFVIGLILRFGQSAEILAWGINFLVMALSGVFNPVDAIPSALQPLSRILPTTHAFSALRTLLDGQPLPWGEIGAGLIGAVICAAISIWYSARMLRTFRRRGYVTRFS